MEENGKGKGKERMNAGKERKCERTRERGLSCVKYPVITCEKNSSYLTDWLTVWF